MPADLKQHLDRLENKAVLVGESYRRLRQKADLLSHRIAELTKRVEELEKENAELSVQVEYLRVVHTVAPNREAVAATRSMLARIVREIDRCIADIGDGCNEG